MSFNQQRDGSGKRASKHDPASSSARFTALIDELDDDSDTELNTVTEEDLAADAAAATDGAAAAATQQRPPSAGRVDTPETSAGIQLQSLLRDEFIIRHISLFTSTVLLPLLNVWHIQSILSNAAIHQSVHLSHIPNSKMVDFRAVVAIEH